MTTTHGPIDEMDAVTRLMRLAGDDSVDLLAARRRLEAAVAHDGPAIVGPTRTRRGPRMTRRRMVAVAAVVVAVAVVAGSVVLTASSPPPRVRNASHHVTPSLPVTRELALIADNTAAQPVPRLGADQLLLTATRISVLATVNGHSATPVEATVNGHSATPVEATVDLTVKKWSNATGQSCTSITTTPAQFPTPADAGGWQALGLLLSPAHLPVTGCASGGIGAGDPGAISGNAGVLNVSPLPADPAFLAHALETGTTGISDLDELFPDGAVSNVAFERAEILLLGPTIGATPAFDAALYRAVALIPGVEGLGQLTTQGGRSGQGFSVSSPEGPDVMVVDATTGALLEARNIEDAGPLNSLATQYLGSSASFNKIQSYRATIQWLDPVGTPTVVDVDALPSNVPLDIFATAKASATTAELLALQQQLGAQYGTAEDGSSFSAAGAVAPSAPAIQQWGFAGPTTAFHDYVQAVEASGLFASVDVI
jgi:hypothetical protein